VRGGESFDGRNEREGGEKGELLPFFTVVLFLVWLEAQATDEKGRKGGKKRRELTSIVPCNDRWHCNPIKKGKRGKKGETVASTLSLSFSLPKIRR